MSRILNEVDLRTQLAGNNRLELLLFRLQGHRQLYGINVFKVKEAIPCPALTQIPYSHPIVLGAATVRGMTFSVFDLAKAIGRQPTVDPEKSFVIMTEYNRSIQGFLVNSVEKIVNISWSQVLPPPPASGAGNYMTAVTQIDEEMVEIIDVEQILVEVLGMHAEVSDDVSMELLEENQVHKHHILVVDDSTVARNQIKRTLDQIGIECTLAKNGKQGLEILKKWSEEGIDVPNYLAMMISDVEMPEMDGYTLTAEVRKDPSLKDLKVMLHTSMSGTFNHALVEKVGADRFIPKFSSDELAREVQSLIQEERRS